MSFLNYYDGKIKEFTEINNFIRIKPENKPISWPESSGVYVIWKLNSKNSKELIYVGMTGKYLRLSDKSVSFNKSLFKKRTARYTPYRFCESPKDEEFKFNFRYFPLYKNTSKQGSIKYEKIAYKETIPYDQLIIDCFLINDSNKLYTPTLFESLILTKYLKEKNNLPKANQSL